MGAVGAYTRPAGVCAGRRQNCQTIKEVIRIFTQLSKLFELLQLFELFRKFDNYGN